MNKSLNSILLIVILISPVFVNAQLNHFIYLQTEGKQPFYAKLDQKVLSSSVSGYLIIPKLKDGTYNITIGFPQKEKGEQTFVCNVDNKDAGYLIKNFGDKGWGLFNLQTLDIVMSGSQPKAIEAVKTEKPDDFSNMLSDVVNDPSIKQQEKPKTVSKPEVVKKEEVKKEIKAEPKVVEIPVTENKSTPVVETPVKVAILKKQAITGEKGTEIIYIDISGDKQDTVTILIPVEKVTTKARSQEEKPNIPEKPAKEALSVETKLKADSLNQNATEQSIEVVAPLKEEPKPVTEENPGIKKEQAKEDKKFLPIEIPATNPPNVVSEQAAVTPMINSDCKNYATEEDFLKLRKKMASTENDDDMIAAAQKFFKIKCYTTDQVKNLSVLFLKDAGKYRFFDLAYQYVSDSHRFSMLENQLTEAYYISRFKAMVRH